MKHKGLIESKRSPTHHLAPRRMIIILTLLAVLFFTACAEDIDSTQTPTPAPGSDTAEPASVNDDPGDSTTRPAPQEQTVSINLGQHPLSIDPLFVTPLDASANDLVDNLFAGLTRLNTDTQQLELGLARGWEETDGGLTWHVTLRDDVYWVNINPTTNELQRIRPIDAEDVVYAVLRACLPENEAPLGYHAGIFVIEGCREIASRSAITQSEAAAVLGVTAVDEFTIRFDLLENAASFPAILSMPMLRPVPRELVDAAGEHWTTPDNIWTSGHYTLQPTLPVEEGYTLIANAFWPQPFEGNVTTVHVAFTQDDTAFDAWLDGQFALTTIPDSVIPDITFGEDPAYRLLAQQAEVFLVFAYDTLPFHDPNVRRAFAYALDREATINTILSANGEAGLPASSIIPPGVAAGLDYSVGGVRFDPDLARENLARAGYANCDGFPTTVIMTDNVFPVSTSLVYSYITQWKNILGCDDDTFVIEEASLYDLYASLSITHIAGQEARPGLTVLGWQGDYPDAQHWLADIIACREAFPGAYLNQPRNCTNVDAELQNLAYLQDSRDRAERYTAINELLFGELGEMPVIPIYYYARPFAIQSNLEAYPLHTGTLRFDQWVVHADD